MRKFFVTGSSRGLGQAITELLLEEPDVHVSGLSRTNSHKHKRFTHIPFDLEEVDNLPGIVDGLFTDSSGFEEVVLINNAGYLGDIQYMGDLDHREFIKVMNVNVIAPAVLMNAFIRNYKKKEGKKVILNIGSGAGRHPYDGWSAYCSSKAAVDMISEVADMESNIRGNDLRIVSIAPGPVDTGMQDIVRSTPVENFSQIDKFKALKESGQLPGVEETARKILTFITRIDEFEGPVQDIRKIPV
jgi:benzil reductase ((S)-benzoin forming)